MMYQYLCGINIYDISHGLPSQHCVHVITIYHRDIFFYFDMGMKGCDNAPMLEKDEENNIVN